MHSSLFCLMAFPCSRYMSLTFFCTLYLYREVKRRVGRRAHFYSRRMGFIGALGGSIVSCGSYQSSACRSISMCVIYIFFSLCLPEAASGRRCLHFFTFVLQASWCSLIAKRTFTLRHGLAFPYAGMTSTTSPNAYIAFLNSLATSAYRAVMIATCVFVSFALGYIPVVGGAVETIFFCWVYA